MQKVRLWIYSALLATSSSLSVAAVKTKTVEYRKDQETFEGLLFYSDRVKGKAPGILMIHNWLGVTEATKIQATRMAELGYVVFAADIFGKGIRPKGPEEASKLVGTYKSNRKLFRERLQLSLDTLKAQNEVNPNNLIAVGYCFGGTGAIELARSGADIKGVVSFHGGLDSPTPADGSRIKARVLALHGADDPYVKGDDLQAFEKEMRDHSVDWQLIKFGGAVHSFTDKSAGTDNSKGAAYNAPADARSFEALKLFLKEVWQN